MSVSKLNLIEGISWNPYINLNLEEKLLNSCDASSLCLYLWQNQNTVVIGRNQSAYRECRVSLLEQEGGHLARRLSGGGAVYHDLGNLNFTFIASKQNLDVSRNLKIILQALQSMNIRAEFSGRNDLLVQGRKFSGNAYYNTDRNCYHHGTLMIDVDQNKVMRYLKPADQKLQAHGVSSVRSRVINLCEVCPDLTADRMKSALIRAAEEEYGLQGSRLNMTADAGRYGDPQWLFRKEMDADMEVSHKYPFAEICIRIRREAGRIADIRILSDAMEDGFCEQWEQVLRGLKEEQIPDAVRKADLPHTEEILQLMEECI